MSIINAGIIRHLGKHNKKKMMTSIVALCH